MDYILNEGSWEVPCRSYHVFLTKIDPQTVLVRRALQDYLGKGALLKVVENGEVCCRDWNCSVEGTIQVQMTQPTPTLTDTESNSDILDSTKLPK